MISCFYSRLRVGEFSPLHAHDFYEFYYALPGLSNGNGRICEACMQKLPDRTVNMKTGELVLFAPGQPHSAASFSDATANCLVLYVDENLFSAKCDADADAVKILQALGGAVENGDILLSLPEKIAHECGKILVDIEDEIARRENGWRCAAKMKTMELLLLVFREWSGSKKLEADFKPSELGRERIRDAISYIETHYMHNLYVEDLMRVLHLSRSHFHSIFRKETGYSFKEFLNRIRVREARKMLERDDMPLSQIALSCGFSSQSRFNHVFKEIAGRTPSRVRKLGEKGRFS